jgi:hypothetical protein
MLTSAECRAQAEAHRAQAERDHWHRKRLLTAAEAGRFSPVNWSESTRRTQVKANAATTDLALASYPIAARS